MKVWLITWSDGSRNLPLDHELWCQTKGFDSRRKNEDKSCN